MAKESQTSQEKSNTKDRRKPKSAVPDQSRGQAAIAEAPVSPIGVIDNPTIQRQAARLNDSRFSKAQRQALSRQIGRRHGNRHLQMVMTAVNHQKSNNGFTSDGNRPKSTSSQRPAASGIQPKLMVNEPDDQYEQEADQVADEVMRMTASTPVPPPDDEDNPSNNQSSQVPRLQTSRPQTSPDDVVDVPPDLEGQIDNLSDGSPLSDQDRDFFEARIGSDFSDVRLHTNGKAIQTSQDLNARAYTIGSDIVFNEGEYQPGSEDGRHLLAHELTHVVQQGGKQNTSKSDLGTSQARSVLPFGSSLQRIEGESEYIQRYDPDDADETLSPLTIHLTVSFREASLEYEFEVEGEVAAWFHSRPNAEENIETELEQIFRPNGWPVHETPLFLGSPAVRRLIENDLRSSATVDSLSFPSLTEFLTGRETSYTGSSFIAGLEDYLEDQGVGVPIDWETACSELISHEPFPINSIIEASDFDRYIMFIENVEAEAVRLETPEGATAPSVETVAPHIVTYIFEVMTAEDWGAAHGWHSEKFLSDWMNELIEIEYVPDDFDPNAFAPDGTAEEIDSERDRIMTEFIDEHAEEVVAMYIRDQLVTASDDADQVIANLDFEAMRDEILDHLADKFIEIARDDEEFMDALRDYSLEQSRFQVLTYLYLAASGQESNNVNLQTRFYTVSDWNELDDFETFVATDPFTYVTQEQAVGQAMMNFFNTVSEGGNIEQATVALAIESLQAAGDSTAYPEIFLLPQALLYLGNLRTGLEEQETVARDRLRAEALPSYDDIVSVIRGAAEFAANFIETEWIPALKRIALRRVTENRDRLQRTVDDWDNERPRSMAKYRLGAAEFGALADQLDSGEVDIIELDGRLLTPENVDELRNAAQVLDAMADRLEDDDSADEEKEKIQEAIDGYDDVEEGIEDEDPFKPWHYGPSIVAEAREELGIGEFTDPEFTTYGMVLRGEAVASENPFLAQAIVAWKYEEILTEQGNTAALFLAVGMFSLASLLVPGAAGLALMAVDLAVGVAMAAEGVSDADDLVDMARLDVDLSIYGVSEEQAEEALSDAWTGLAISIVLAVGITALYARMILRSGTGTVSPGFANIEGLLRSDPTLLNELISLTSDVRRLERILDAVRDASKAKELLLLAEGVEVESLLSRVGNNADVLHRILRVADGAAAGRLLDVITDGERLANLLDEAGDATRVENLITELGGDEVARIAGQYGGTRLGVFVRELEAAELVAMVADLSPSRISGLERLMTTADVVKVHRAAGESGIAQIERIQAMQDAGRVRGLDDWAGFSLQKSGDDLANTITELGEAERLAAEHPGSIINVGGDARAPTRPDGSPMRSFDFTVEDPGGAVTRSVEVTSVRAVTRAGDISPRIRHANAKIRGRIADGEPIPGQYEVSVEINLSVGERGIGRGRIRRISESGDITIIYPGGREIAQGNIFDDFVGHLNTPLGREVDFVTTVDQSGQVLAQYEKAGGAWTRIQ